MEGMIEQVMSLCPGCGRDEVESDLNITGDIEMTLNHALDGLLSPKSSSFSVPKQTSPVNLVMDDDNDVIMMSSSKFTNIRDRNETNNELTTNNFNAMPSLNIDKAAKFIEISKTTNNDRKISVDLTDSDSELTDVSTTCQKTLERLKSSIINLEASTSKTFKDTTCSKESVCSSSDSDSELLKPTFDYDHTQTTSNNLSAKICLKGNFSETVVDKSKDYHIVDLHVERIREVKESSESIQDNDDVCLNEPVKKKKRTKEEVQERKREAMLKKAAKEKERQEKLEEKKRQKESRAAAMKEKKLQKEKEQLQKKAERLTKSVNKLDGCMKFITVYLDLALFSEEVPDPDTNIIIQKLISMDTNYAIASQPYPGSVLWQRTSMKHSVQEDELRITTSDFCQEENEVLVVLAAEQFAEMVFSFKQGYVGGHDSLEERPDTLVDFTKYVKNIYRGKKVTFLVNGLEKYMRDVQLKQKRAFRDLAVGEHAVENGTRKRRKKKTQAVLDVTRTDIEEALVDLQIKTDVCVYQCETDEDIAMKIGVFTKAVAEKPYKKSLSDGIGFCLDRLDKTSLKISKDGQGMVNVWIQQIQQFRNVSREMAAAIVAVYPSPQLLKNTYEQCRSPQDAMLLLEDIVVRRGGGSLATSRRIGPELSRRFYILFHSKENSELVKG